MIFTLMEVNTAKGLHLCGKGGETAAVALLIPGLCFTWTARSNTGHLHSFNLFVHHPGSLQAFNYNRLIGHDKHSPDICQLQ